MHKKDYLHLAGWIVVFEVMGFLLGLLTKNNIPFWYHNLIKSDFNPPSITFSIVWSLLYVLLAVTGWRLWKNQKTNFSQESKNIWYLFVAQMIMNWLWTPIFFQFHWIGISLVWLIVLICLNLLIVYRLIKIDAFHGVCYLLYILWLFFATYLNAVIYWYN